LKISENFWFTPNGYTGYHILARILSLKKKLMEGISNKERIVAAEYLLG
jgi:hypothetical protein